ncbi:TPA: hypothetical protein IMH49_005383, partial [Escherichia coli]
CRYRIVQKTVLAWDIFRFPSGPHFEGNGAKKPHSYPVSISVIRFNSHFRSYGAQGVLKKHPFCGVFLIFWEF